MEFPLFTGTYRNAECLSHPTHCFPRCSAHHVLLTSKCRTNPKRRKICFQPSRGAVGGHGKRVANLAELEADSSGKLCAEVDKDTSGCTQVGRAERPRHFRILSPSGLEFSG